jgi:general stress protein YciG
MDQSVKSYMQRIGRKGGRRRAEQLTPERRREIARLGGVALSTARRLRAARRASFLEDQP